MKKRMLSIAVATGLVVTLSGFAVAQATKEVKKVPVSSTRADSGVEMFKTYCAACHGTDGKGGGPAASALKIPPSDLTVLSHKNGGKFPGSRVSMVVEGSGDISAHGSSDMPTWGPIFHSLAPTNEALVKLRVANVVKYIESIQQ